MTSKVSQYLYLTEKRIYLKSLGENGNVTINYLVCLQQKEPIYKTKENRGNINRQE